MASFTTLLQAFSYLESFTNFEKLPPQTVRDLKLDRMVDLLHRNGNPHQEMMTVHIAGSKGKGSTAAFLAQILTAAGLRTGLYTSPHVQSYTERITLAGTPFPDHIYLTQAEVIKDTVDGLAREQLAGDWEPTTFELLTLLAFLVFRDAGCTWGVIETGIGGRLDATNIIQPEAVILTPIEMEHTDILGESIEQIAAEKAGIIKEKVPAFCAPQPFSEASEVFEKTAARLNTSLNHFSNLFRSFEIEAGGDGTYINCEWNDGFSLRTHINMLGDFQGENALLAASCARRLLRPQFEETEIAKAIKEGLSQTRIHGRMELIKGSPPIVLDGAHTLVSVARSGENFAKVFSGKRVLLFGSVSGKDWAGMAEALAPYFDVVIVSTPGTFKKSDPKMLLSIFKNHHPAVELVPEPAEALERSRKEAGPAGAILVTGSFYMIGEIAELIK